MSELARTLDELVLSLPGVVSLFSTEPALARSARELVGGDTSRVLVSGAVDAAPDRIVVSLGVSADAQAPVTAAGVAAAIRSQLPPDAATEIVVRISRVVT